MGLADFDINDDGGDQAYEGELDEVLSFTLRTSPPNGIRRWTLQVFDADTFEPTEGIDANPPRQSTDAPELVLELGATTGQRISTTSVSSTITTTLPSSGVHSWIVRSIVNGGRDRRGNLDPELIRERMVYVPAAPGGIRKIVVTETTQAHDDGWSEPINRLIEEGGGGGEPPPSGDDPGYLSRHVYAHASSAKIGQTVLGVEVEEAPTWTTAADIPPGRLFHVVLYGPAAGANGGNVTNAANANVGGGATGGGARRERWFSRQELIDALPIAWDLPLGGNGGAGASGAGNAVGTRGSAPSGPARFGDLLEAYQGGRAAATAQTTAQGGGGGGGEESAGSDGSGSNSGAGGDPFGGAGTAAGNNPSLYGGGSGGGSAKGGNSRTGGGGGGAGLTAGSTPLQGGSSQQGGTGGGAGGGHNSARTIATNGGQAGSRLAPTTAGNAGGVVGAAIDGVDGADCTVDQGGMGGSGGAAAVGTAPQTAGNGGDGGFGGGGAGGGGSAGTTDAGANTAGNGGKGGDAAGIFTAYD